MITCLKLIIIFSILVFCSLIPSKISSTEAAVSCAVDDKFEILLNTCEEFFQFSKS